MRAYQFLLVAESLRKIRRSFRRIATLVEEVNPRCHTLYTRNDQDVDGLSSLIEQSALASFWKDSRMGE